MVHTVELSPMSGTADIPTILTAAGYRPTGEDSVSADVLYSQILNLSWESSMYGFQGPQDVFMTQSKQVTVITQRFSNTPIPSPKP